MSNANLYQRIISVIWLTKLISLFAKYIKKIKIIIQDVFHYKFGLKISIHIIIINKILIDLFV